MTKIAELSVQATYPSSNTKFSSNASKYIVVLIALLAFGGAASAEDCKNGYRPVNVSPLTSGIVVYGPTCVSVPVNGLRYSAVLSYQVTYTAVDLTAGVAKPGAPGPNPADGTDKFLKEVAVWSEGIKKDLDQNTLADENAITSVNKAVADITSVVSMSDTVFQESKGTDSVLAQVEVVRGRLAPARAATYKPLEDFVTKLTNMQNALQKLEIDNPALGEPAKTLLGNEMASVSSMLATASAYLPNADKSVNYIKQRQIFEFWDDRLSKVTAAEFVVRQNVACETLAHETKSIGIALSRIDLSPTLSGSMPVSVSPTSALVTVTCPSAFSVSGGLAISFVKTQTYGLIPTSTAGTSTFGITKITNQSLMPIAMVHARLYGYRHVALHAGFGVAAHAQDDAAGGTGAEYLLGLGVSLFRTIYITPGWQSGRTAALSPGYSLGQTAASGVTAAPLVNGYSSGFGLAITFTKP